MISAAQDGAAGSPAGVKAVQSANEAKASRTTQEFFALLAVIDITGSHSIMSWAAVLFAIKLDDPFVEANVQLIGGFLYVAAVYTFIDGIYKGMNVFGSNPLPSLSELMLDWIVYVACLMVLLPVASAGGGELNIVLLTVSVLETIIVLFVASKIQRFKVRLAITATVGLVTAFGIGLALFVAHQVRYELVDAQGQSILDEKPPRQQRTPDGLKESAIAITLFVVLAFFSCGVFSASICYSKQVGSVTYLGFTVSGAFDAVFRSRAALPFFFVIIPILRLIEAVHWLCVGFRDMCVGMKCSKMSKNGAIVFDFDDTSPYIPSVNSNIIPLEIDRK